MNLVTNQTFQVLKTWKVFVAVHQLKLGRALGTYESVERLFHGNATIMDMAGLLLWFSPAGKSRKSETKTKESKPTEEAKAKEEAQAKAREETVAEEQPGADGEAYEKGGAKTKAEHFEDLAKKRKEKGLPEADSPTDDATVAKLKVGNDEFYGFNRKYQNPKTEVTLKANAQTVTHAEADCVQQAIDKGKTGTAKEAEMWVDREACTACGEKNGIGSLSRELGVDKITRLV
jgi:hypothetical protein